MPSTSNGRTSRAIPLGCVSTSSATSTASRTALRTCERSRACANASRRSHSSRRASTMGTRDLMVCVAASELHDGDVVFVGIGLPSLACNLARATHAPALQLIYESGTVGTRPARIPLSIGDPALVTDCTMVAPMMDVFQMILQRGHIDVG